MALDEDIINAISEMESLLKADAYLSEIEAAQRRLSSLVAEKRQRIFGEVDAIEYLEPVFRESTPESRRTAADRMEERILQRLRQIRWTTGAEGDAKTEAARPVVESLSEVLRTLRNLARDPSYHVEESSAAFDPSEYDPDACLKYCQADFDPDFLAEELVRSGYLSSENAEYMKDLLSDFRMAFERDIEINWKGDARSLVTFVVVGYDLHLFHIDSQPHVRKVKTEKDKAPKIIKEMLPNFESAILNTFLVRGEKLSVGISRTYVNPLRKQIPKYLRFVRERNKVTEKTGTRFEELTRWMTEATNEELKPELGAKVPKLDLDILGVFDTLVANGLEISN